MLKEGIPKGMPRPYILLERKEEELRQGTETVRVRTPTACALPQSPLGSNQEILSPVYQLQENVMGI